MDKVTNPIIAAIAAIAEPKGYTLTSLAKAAGLADTTLTKKKNATGEPNTTTLRKVAAVLGCKPEDFFAHPSPPAPHVGDVRPAPIRRPAAAGMRKDLPVRGTAAGSAVNGFEITPNVIEYVRRPPALEGVDDAYAIYVVGNSMIPQHSPGDLRFVHPHRMCKAGDSVIIQIQTHPNAPIEAYIKTFIRETAEEIVAEQHNPPATLRYKRRTVFAIHRILTINELFGV